jgi:hypothetical protein
MPTPSCGLLVSIYVHVGLSVPAATWNGWAIYYTFPLADGDAGVLCDSLFQGALGLETPSDPILC